MKYYLTTTCNELYSNFVINYIQSNTVNTPYYFKFERYIGTGTLEFVCDSDTFSDYTVNHNVKTLILDLENEVNYLYYTIRRNLLVPN